MNIFQMLKLYYPLSDSHKQNVFKNIITNLKIKKGHNSIVGKTLSISILKLLYILLFTKRDIIYYAKQ